MPIINLNVLNLLDSHSKDMKNFTKLKKVCSEKNIQVQTDCTQLLKMQSNTSTPKLNSTGSLMQFYLLHRLIKDNWFYPDVKHLQGKWTKVN